MAVGTLNSILESNEVYCMISCEWVVDRRVCAWEYKKPDGVGGWIHVDSEGHAGSLDLSLQCTSIYVDQFPAYV